MTALPSRAKTIASPGAGCDPGGRVRIGEDCFAFQIVLEDRDGVALRADVGVLREGETDDAREDLAGDRAAGDGAVRGGDGIDFGFGVVHWRGCLLNISNYTIY